MNSISWAALSPHREQSAVGDDQRHDDEGHAIPHFVAHGVHCLAASARKF